MASVATVQDEAAEIGWIGGKRFDLFYFFGSALVAAVLGQWLFKSLYEVIATPLTYLVINKLKAVEGVDAYDRRGDFNPLRLEA